MRRCPRRASADDDRVAIGDRTAIGRAAHVPDTVNLSPVDEAFDRLRLAVGVADRHVMPATAAHGKPILRPPAMPVAL